MGKVMQRRDCGERDARRDTRRGLWGKGCKEGAVGKGMQGEIQGGDCGERDARKGLLGKRSGDGKRMQSGKCGKKDAGLGLWGKGCGKGKWM